ncbi:hypothetical protein [Candidatus Poriferisodalis sp.]|uniref:hypothetical protein n=1 Tax=Candidatus Poriferisodalis sp. TaxID=3101277 RepID=UPI003B529ED3
MVTIPCRRVLSGCLRAGAPMVVLISVLAACSRDVVVPADPGPTIAASPSTPAADAPDPALFELPITEARTIVAGSGEFPKSRLRELSPELPPEVQIGGGRIWVPWAPYPDSDVDDTVAVVGSQSALLADMDAGFRHVVSQRSRWEAMPPYVPAAEAALAGGTRVAQKRAGTETAWELVVDPAGLEYETRLVADRRSAYDHVSLCPPHPTSQALGVDVGETAAERDRASAALEAFIAGMRSPGRRPMHSWGTTVNDIAKLLVYSPGEPMELALGGHSLTDLGYFPGDWSAKANQWLTRRAAQGAVTDSLVGHAALSLGPGTVWEACSDLASITPGVYTESHRTRQLESLWARGLRLVFTTPPVERAWVADLSAAGHALAVVCHAPGQSFLVDASTGERLDAGTEHRPQVEAMWLTWSRHSYRVLRNALFDGACDSETFEQAVQWLAEAQQAHAATIDWTEPGAWGSGVRNEWIAVRKWVDVPQREAWRAHRDDGWHLEFWCSTGIPVGVLVGGELHRPELEEPCTPEQWEALREAATNAPVVTSELSATTWDPGVSWHDRMYLSPFKSLEEILGCPPGESVIVEALERPPERRVKKPWPPGSLPLTDAERAYPRPMPPCPQAGWPPQTDLYWWPLAPSLLEMAP